MVREMEAGRKNPLYIRRLIEMKEVYTGVFTFDNDQEYLDWTDRNPEGYLVNPYTEPKASYLMVHRAECRTIKKLTGKGTSFTTTGYSKFCSLELDKLKEWAAQKVHGELQPCKICLQ